MFKTSTKNMESDETISNDFKQAVRCLVNDTENKYDECLVDRYFDFITHDAFVFLTTQNMVTELYNQSNFEKLNLTRVLRFHRSVHGNKIQQVSDMREQASVFWKRLPMIVKSSDHYTISAALSLLDSIAKDKTGYLWLMDMQFSPPIGVSELNQTASAINNNNHDNSSDTPVSQTTIQDAAQLAKYYMINSRNYQIQTKAEELFMILVSTSCKFQISPLHRIVISAKQVIEELLTVGSDSIYHVLFKVFKEIYTISWLDDRYNISLLIRKRFEKALDKNLRDLNSICKCMGMISTQKDAIQVIDKLKATNNLEAIIIHVSHLREDLVNQSLLTYVVYPILTSCYSEDARVLIPKLFITRSERNFIDRNVKEKLVTMCINYIKGLFRTRYSYARHFHGSSSRKQFYCLDVIHEYIRCHYSTPKAFKNILECLHTIKDARRWMGRKTEAVWLFHLIESFHEIIDKIDISTCQNKAILLEIIQILSASNFSTTMFKIDKVDFNVMKTIELAFKFTDHDILNEFAEFFCNNRFNFSLDKKDVQRYVELIWSHIYSNAKDTDHRELLGNVAYLLIYIDLEVEAPVLERMQLRRFHDIPTLLGNLLIKYSTVYPTVENIIKGLHSTGVTAWRKSGHQSMQTNFSYLCYLDSNTLPRTVKRCLDHVIKGVCATVKGESSELTRIHSIEEINALIEEFLVNSDDHMFILKRIIRTGILETLHEIVTNPLYSDIIFERADHKIGRIQKNIIKKMERKKRVETIVSLIAKDVTEDDKGPRMARAHEVANFYSSEIVSKRETRDISPKAGNKLNVHSFVDQIITQQKISHSISECY